MPENRGMHQHGLCQEAICLPDINGEAYPENSRVPVLPADKMQDLPGISDLSGISWGVALTAGALVANHDRGYHDMGDIAVYYVIQVAPGKEEETEKYIAERVSQEWYSSCFHPVRHVKKKFRGEWKDRHEKLMPGYVFIDSENAKELYLDLKRIPMMTKLLGWEREFITALTEEETDWLEKMVSADKGGKVTGEVAISRIEVGENDTVRILSGPLKDMAGMVKRINLHKRIAEVEVEFMRRKIVLYLGIEMVEKKV